MDSHDKEFFDRLMALSEENNRLLRKLTSMAKMARAWRVLYWIIVIGISIGAYYYIQPYLGPLMKAFSSIQQDAASLKNLTNGFRNGS